MYDNMSTDRKCLRESNTALKEALRQRDFQLQRQAKVVQKIRNDRDMMSNELLEWKWRCEERSVELRNCQKELQRVNDRLKESKRTESNTQSKGKDDIEVYKDSIKELLHRNAKQDIIVKSLISENRSLKKGIAVKLPQLRNAQSRLMAPRMSIS